MEKEIIKKHIGGSLNLLYDNDLYLLSNRVNERTITGKLACYLRLFIKEYDVDCEYNKDKDRPKSINGSRRNPDIIIHKRGTNDYNILWCECKTYRSPTGSEKKDIKTIKGSMNSELNYKFGLYIEFGETLVDCKITFFYKNDKLEIVEENIYF